MLLKDYLSIYVKYDFVSCGNLHDFDALSVILISKGIYTSFFGRMTYIVNIFCCCNSPDTRYGHCVYAVPLLRWNIYRTLSFRSEICF